MGFPLALAHNQDDFIAKIQEPQIMYSASATPPVPLKLRNALTIRCLFLSDDLERHVSPVSHNTRLPRTSHHQFAYVSGVRLPHIYSHKFYGPALAASARRVDCWPCGGQHFHKVSREEVDTAAARGTLHDHQHPSFCRVT
jgi:hypothetical protein